MESRIRRKVYVRFGEGDTPYPQGSTVPTLHPDGSQQALLTGLAHLYNLVPYPCRARHAGQCGREVEGGKVPPRDWLLSLQILTSGGFR